MLSRLPRWVEYGAFTLAMLAGMVNVVGLLGFQHEAVSHLSGMATLLGAKVITESQLDFHLIAILVSFFLGSAISGFFISGGSLRLGRHYDSVLILEGGLLLAAIYFLNGQVILGHYLASAACGIQNAMATRYSGAIIRTTHITGIITDLGMMFGAALRGERASKRTLILFLLIITGFVLGGSIGAFLYLHFKFVALAFPAGVCFMLAAGYRFYSMRY